MRIDVASVKKEKIGSTIFIIGLSSIVMVISGTLSGIVAEIPLVPACKLVTVIFASPKAFALNITDNNLPLPLTPPMVVRAETRSVIFPAKLSILLCGK